MTKPAAPRYSPQALAFLRSLKRNNRREWFVPRKGVYDTQVRQPTLDIVARLADDLRMVAPEIVADQKSAVYRIYRDVRFSANKAPYKTHVAASFPTRGLAKHQGAGLYFHVSPDEVWIGGGVYAPPPQALVAIREHIAGNTRRLRAIVESPAFRRTFGALEGARLQRVPRGFRADHAGAEYLKFKQIFAGRELPGSAATRSDFYQTLLTTFRQVLPLVRFLNEPLMD